MEDQPAPFLPAVARQREPNPVETAYLAAAAMVATAEARRHAVSRNVRGAASRDRPQLAITPANRSNHDGGLDMDPMMCATAHVEAMIERGEAFSDIEEYIETVGGLTEDQRSALWLVAWAEAERPERRQVLLSMSLA